MVSKKLEQYFRICEHGSTIKTEILAGCTTFLTMAYIIFVNPAILAETGMDFHAVFVATCIASALGCLLMGAIANYPIAIAPGMGLNAYFTYSVVQGMGISWQVALGAVFLSGIIFLIVSLFKLREWLVNAIPQSLKFSIATGVGLFLALIALKNAHIVVGHPATLVTLGNVHDHTLWLAVAGFLLILALEQRRISGSVIIGILAVTVLAVLFGYQKFTGVFASPPSLAPTLLQMDIHGALNMGLLSVVFVFFLVDLFDTSGTLVGVSQQAGLLDRDGKLPRLQRALLCDSSAIVAGAALGTSSCTAYIESTAGTAAGGRTGLTAVTVALLFLAALFLSPLAATIPPYATAPALLYVAILMARGFTQIPWDDLTESAPAVITALAIPFTFSIADGIAAGFIVFTGIKLFSGRFRELTPAVLVITALWLLRFALL